MNSFKEVVRFVFCKQYCILSYPVHIWCIVYSEKGKKSFHPKIIPLHPIPILSPRSNIDKDFMNET